MNKFSTKHLVFIFLSLAIILTSCTGSTEDENINYTVALKSKGGLPLEGIVLNVYEDKSLEKLIWASTTDENGSVSFTAPESDGYCVVLKDEVKGYSAKEYYLIEERDFTISLENKLLPKESLSDTTFSLGDTYLDFEITDSEGRTHKLSELLKTKNTVVLNFWFINCGPCKMEFPYLENAYKKYSEDIALIAINPVDATDDSISAFAKDNELTFPMAVGEPEWERAMLLTAYPTTVVIDRYGTVAMIHKGSITKEGEFEKIFEFFSSEDYVQTTLSSISDIETQ